MTQFPIRIPRPHESKNQNRTENVVLTYNVLVSLITLIHRIVIFYERRFIDTLKYRYVGQTS